MSHSQVGSRVASRPATFWARSLWRRLSLFFDGSVPEVGYPTALAPKFDELDSIESPVHEPESPFENAPRAKARPSPGFIEKFPRLLQTSRTGRVPGRLNN